MKLSEWNGDFSGIDYVSLIVIDIDGRMRAVSLPSSYATEAVLKKALASMLPILGMPRCMHRIW